ncbi:MAG: hypothetical protein WCI83_07570 [Thermoleophilia bacterium]
MNEHYLLGTPSSRARIALSLVGPSRLAPDMLKRSLSDPTDRIILVAADHPGHTAAKDSS